jgi:hypothetical protein
LAAFGFIYLYIGAPDRAFEIYQTTTQAGYHSAGGADNAYLWHSSYAALRKTERFKAWVRAEGMVDYPAMISPASEARRRGPHLRLCLELMPMNHRS